MRAQISTGHKEDLFTVGLQAAGYDVTTHNIHDLTPEDTLLVWNRKPTNTQLVNRYERAGCRVLVAENGYIGTDDAGGKLVALAVGGHLGKGRWHVGEEPRHQNHNFTVMPWREPGDEIVILAQRGIGDSKTPEWAEDLRIQIRQATKRPVRVRLHPGKTHTPCEPDIEHAHAVVTWSSAAAIRAVAFGVPAFFMMPGWIGAPAAVFGIDDLERPYRGDREPMFHRVGWAQWTAAEVASGEAIKTLKDIK